MTHESPKMHHEISGYLDLDDWLYLAAPRGFAKSSWSSRMYPTREALFEKKRNIHIISATEGLAVSWLRDIKKKIEMDPLIGFLFGDMTSKKWTEDHIILSNGVEIRARGAGGQSRGPRPDLVILDDIETEDSVATKERRDKLRDWINKAVIPSLTYNGRLVWIGTYINPLCLLKEEIEKKDGMGIRKMYAAYDNGVMQKGKEIWPELWGHERLQERRSQIGDHAFASEYLNNPMYNDASPIRKEMVRYFKDDPDDYNVIISIDPAYSEDKTADFKTCGAIAFDGKNRRYLMEYINTHDSMGDFIDDCIDLYLKYRGRVLAMGCPNSGPEKAFFEMLRRRIEERRENVILKAVSNSYVSNGQTIRNKHKRIIAALQPIFEQGRYFIREEHEDAEYQLLSVGFSKNDDIIDMMTYAESMIEPNATIYKEEPEVDHFGYPINKQEEENVYDYGYN